MTFHTKSKLHANHARVIDFTRFRTSQQPRAEDALARRTELVQAAARDHLETHPQPPIALAMILLRADGRFVRVVEAIEPEQAEFFAEELETTATKLRQISNVPPRQRGFVTLTTLSCLAFAGATYWVESAVGDALLTLVAQVMAGVTAKLDWRPSLEQASSQA